MKPEYLTVEQLVVGRQFMIPDYQRPYSWQTQQRKELFGDLLKLNEVEDDRHHFMATIVCSRTDRREKVNEIKYLKVREVVDGQQRLTTLLILIKSLALILEKERNELAEDVQDILVPGRHGLVLLQTNHDEAGIFSAYLRGGDVPEVNRQRTHSSRNLALAIAECREFSKGLANEGLGNITRLLNRILNNIGLIYYEVDDSHSVYTVFELLNSRGLAVDWMDKCKSILMGAADEQDCSAQVMDEIKSVWSRIYAAVGVRDVPGDEVMRFTATLIAETRPSALMNSQEAFDLIKQQANSGPDEPLTLSSVMEQVVSKRVQLEEFNLRTAVAHIVHARFLWIAINLSNILETHERETALTRWERITFRVFGLHRNDSRTAKGVYARLAYDIYNGEIDYRELMDRIEELAEDYDIESALEKVRQTDCYENWQAQLRYLLYEFEKHSAKVEGGRIAEDVIEAIWMTSPNKSIEHIAPVEPGADWEGLTNELGDDYSFQINRIGNLCLLAPADNSRAKNRSFEKKREIYAKSGLPSIRQISGKDDWGVNEINQREDVLIEWIRERWA